MCGFVYIWRDRKHKKYYIGSHWGNIDDGYICSSSWMKQAYRQRPQDFKRRILKSEISDRITLYEEEQRWFNFIKDEEIGKRYYNLTLKVKLHWTLDPNKLKTVGQKISKTLKEKYESGEISKNNSSFFKVGQTAPMKGRKLSEERKKEISNIKNGSTPGPYKNKTEYCEAWNKKMNPNLKSRIGKGGKYKPVNIKGISFNSCSEAAKHFGVSMNTITRWKNAS